MKKLTVYGLPLNPTTLLDEIKGASFCVSYATRAKLGDQLDQAISLVGEDQILLVDNGAFSYHKSGGDTRCDKYWDGFTAWAQDILDRCPQAWVVAPDVIGGTAEENNELALWAIGAFGPDRLMAVWHLHEGIDYLLHLCEGYGYVAFGSSGEYWQAGTEKWHARIREAFAAIDTWERESEGAYVRPRIHMMRAQAFAHLYPFDSSDSTNVAMNHGRYRKTGPGHVARFAERVDTKIQLSCDRLDAEHQAKRPLLDHIEQAEFEARMTLLNYLTRLEIARAVPKPALTAINPAPELARAIAEVTELGERQRATREWRRLKLFSLTASRHQRHSAAGYTSP